MALNDILESDIATIFAAGGFTIEVLHTYSGGASSENLEVLFDAPYKPLFGDEQNIESARPQILVQRADIGNIADDSNFTIDGTIYYIQEVQDDVSDLVVRYLLSEDPRQ